VSIEFMQSRDAVVAFANDYVKTSKAVQKQIFRTRSLFGGILLPWGLAYFWLDKPYAAVVMSTIPVTLILLWPRFTAWSARRHLVRELEGDERPAWLSDGTCKLEIDSEKLVVSRAESETRISPSALEALHETATHVFIYTSPTMGIAISRSRVTSGNLEQFVSELRVEMSDAR
jgi:hypothetical protein